MKTDQRTIDRWLILVLALGCAALTQGVSAEGPASEALASAVGDGIRADLDLGTQRTNWTHARWKVVKLDKPVDLSAFGQLQLTVTTDNPRTDAGVYLALREADGTWRSHPWACDLTQATNTGVARFEDFSLPLYHNPPGGSFKDEAHTLDTAEIDAIGGGVAQPPLHI